MTGASLSSEFLEGAHLLNQLVLLRTESEKGVKEIKVEHITSCLLEICVMWSAEQQLAQVSTDWLFC